MSRFVTVKKGTCLHRFLTTRLIETSDEERAQRSRFCYGVEEHTVAWSTLNGQRIATFTAPTYYLRPVGILHGLFGIGMMEVESDGRLGSGGSCR